MKTQQIPRDEWPKFFDAFSRQHEGWLTTIEMFGPEFGAQIEERELAFGGIVVEPDEAQENQLFIMVGDNPNDHITHSIPKPTEVNVEQTDEGSFAVIAINSADGVMALMRFRSPMLPEIAGGLLGFESPPPL